MTKRCHCLATTTGLICKHNYKYLIHGTRYCTIHAKLEFNKCVTKIQSLYRGYMLRKKIDTIFKPLPRELQRKILWHMRDEIYAAQQHKSIRDILKNRVTKTFDETYEDRRLRLAHVHLPKLLLNNNAWGAFNHLKQISDIYYLHNKYFDIADLSDIKILLTWWNRSINKFFVPWEFEAHDHILSCLDSVNNMNEKWIEFRKLGTYY